MLGERSSPKSFSNLGSGVNSIAHSGSRAILQRTWVREVEGYTRWPAEFEGIRRQHLSSNCTLGYAGTVKEAFALF